MNLLQYFRDSREELTRVTWPTRSQVIEGTQAVLVFTVALTIALWLMDMLFGAFMNLLLKGSL